MKGKGFVLRFVGAVDTSSTGRVLKRSPWSPGMTFFREGAVEAGRPSGRCPCGLGEGSLCLRTSAGVPGIERRALNGIRGQRGPLASGAHFSMFKDYKTLIRERRGPI